MRFFTILGLSVVCLAACQPMKETHALTEPTGKLLEAKPGDTVLSIVKEKSLPSEIAEGHADFLGRTTMTGLTTLQYRGVENGRAVFKRRTMQMESAATDLKPALKPRVINEADLNIFVNLGQAKRMIVVERRTLLIQQADNQRLVYSISDPAPAPAPAQQGL